MRKAFLFLFLLTSISLLAQKKKTSLTIIPGVGVGQLKLGMSSAAAKKLLGAASTEHTYEEEMKGFKENSSNFSIDSIVQFVIGFDKVIVYDKLPYNYPVYNLYFDKDKLVYFTLTTYSASASLLNKFVMNNGVRFQEKKAVALQKFGTDYLPISYGDYDGDHVYYKKGLEVTYDEGKLTVVSIFKATPDFLKMIEEKRDKLKAEFEAIEIDGAKDEN